MARRLSSKQAYVLEYVRANPGVCAMDVNRHEWGGRGHFATYQRINRMLSRGLITRGPCVTSKNGYGLYVV